MTKAARKFIDFKVGASDEQLAKSFYAPYVGTVRITGVDKRRKHHPIRVHIVDTNRVGHMSVPAVRAALGLIN